MQLNSDFKGERILKLLNEPQFVEALLANNNISKESVIKVLDHVTLQKYDRDLLLQQQKNSLQYLIQEQLESRMKEKQKQDQQAQFQINTLYSKIENLNQQMDDYRKRTQFINQEIQAEVQRNREYESTLNDELMQLNKSLQGLEKEARIIDDRNQFLLKDIHLYDILTKENMFLKDEVKQLNDQNIFIQKELNKQKEEKQKLESSSSNLRNRDQSPNSSLKKMAP